MPGTQHQTRKRLQVLTAPGEFERYRDVRIVARKILRLGAAHSMNYFLHHAHRRQATNGVYDLIKERGVPLMNGAVAGNVPLIL